MFATALAVRPDEETEVRNDCVTSSCCHDASARLAYPEENAPNSNGDGALNLPLNISKDFITDVLKPYRAHVQYLKSAELTHFRDKSSPTAVGQDAGIIK